jgi:hypothetical protein
MEISAGEVTTKGSCTESAIPTSNRFVAS